MFLVVSSETELKEGKQFFRQLRCVRQQGQESDSPKLQAKANAGDRRDYY